MCTHEHDADTYSEKHHLIMIMLELQYEVSCCKYDSINVPELASIYLVSCESI